MVKEQKKPDGHNLSDDCKYQFKKWDSERSST